MRVIVAALALLGAAGVGVTGCTGSPQPTTVPSTTSAREPASAQTVLPFNGLENPQDVAVDAAGNVYVADLHRFKDDKGYTDVTTRVIKLAAGSTTPNVLPQFSHAHLMTDASGTVWVEDAGNSRLVKLAAGSDTQTALPLPDLGVHGAIQTVDDAGNVYGTNGGGVDPNGACCLTVHVVKSVAGSATPTVLPFKGIDGIGGMAVNAAGDLYVGDYDHHQVLKLTPRSDTPAVLPLKDADGIVDIAVDKAGNVYVVEAQHNQVLKFPEGAAKPTVLPLTGVENPIRVTVDTSGNVYVVDGGNRQVVKITQP